jgi:hypothetical protein
VVRELYTGIGAETRPDTVHSHVHYITNSFKNLILIIINYIRKCLIKTIELLAYYNNI